MVTYSFTRVSVSLSSTQLSRADTGGAQTARQPTADGLNVVFTSTRQTGLFIFSRAGVYALEFSFRIRPTCY